MFVQGPDLTWGNLWGKAWGTFKARPVLCIAMWFVYTLFNGNGGGGGSGSGGGGEMGTTILLVLAGVGCVMFLVAPAVRAGFQLSFARLVRGDETVRFTDIFSGFSRFLGLLLLQILALCILIPAFLLLVIPGVILWLGLWPAYVIMLEDGIGPVDALKSAWALTSGHKFQFFVLAILCFFLNVLGVLCLCIGVLVTAPLTELIWMAAYQELRDGQQAAA